MHLPSLFILIVYVSAYLSLLFAAICLACGLYYLIELTEEYTMLTKRIIRIIIQVNLVLHLLLYLYERFPLFPCLVGALSHLVYLQLLHSFPFLRPLSPPFIASCLAFVVDNVVWFRYFHSDIELFYRYQIAPLPATIAFFILLIWLVPSAFFCSLTVNDSVLPSAGGMSMPMPTQHQQYVDTAMGGAMPMGMATKNTHRKNVVMIALDKCATLLKNGLASINGTAGGRRSRASDQIFS